MLLSVEGQCRAPLRQQPPRLPASPPPSMAVSPLSSHLPTLLTRVPVIELLSDSFWPCSGGKVTVGEQLRQARRLHVNTGSAAHAVSTDESQVRGLNMQSGARQGMGGDLGWGVQGLGKQRQPKLPAVRLQ